MNQLYTQLITHMDKASAINTALSLFSWDAETLAPEQAMNNTAKTIGILSNEYFSIVTNPEFKELVHSLSKEENQSDLDFNQKAIVKHYMKSIEELENVPANEYQAYSELTAKSQSIWSKAKKNNSFEDFAPTLKAIVDFQKKFIGYRNKKEVKPYDVLLNDFEESFNMEKLDNFFNKVKETVVPLLKKVSALSSQIDNSFNTLSYPIELQKEINTYIADYVGFDFSKGVLAESAHPFTLNLHNKDVRITTHYHEHNLISSIFSVIHEAGHAIYEMNIADSITQTPVGTGSSMGIHESQSRFFENIVGRSYDFWLPLYDKLKNTFPEQLSNVTLTDFVRAINKSEPSLIRTEADELSYSLHVIIRYEIEKMLFADEITVADLPTVWNRKYKEYLGMEATNDSEGVLQDIHWAGGSFGYFPSYAIGSAISAQIYAYMKTQIPVETYLQEGNITPIIEFLSKHIHQYGATKNTKELLLGMMNEEFNPQYFIDYITDKYTTLYNL